MFGLFKKVAPPPRLTAEEILKRYTALIEEVSRPESREPIIDISLLPAPKEEVKSALVYTSLDRAELRPQLGELFVLLARFQDTSRLSSPDDEMDKRQRLAVKIDLGEKAAQEAEKLVHEWRCHVMVAKAAESN